MQPSKVPLLLDEGYTRRTSTGNRMQNKNAFWSFGLTRFCALIVFVLLAGTTYVYLDTQTLQNFLLMVGLGPGSTGQRVLASWPACRQGRAYTAAEVGSGPDSEPACQHAAPWLCAHVRTITRSRQLQEHAAREQRSRDWVLRTPQGVHFMVLTYWGLSRPTRSAG